MIWLALFAALYLTIGFGWTISIAVARAGCGLPVSGLALAAHWLLWPVSMLIGAERGE